MPEFWTPVAANADSASLNVAVALVILACLLAACLVMARGAARQRTRRHHDC